MEWKFCFIVCFDLIFVLSYSESGSLRCFFSATCLSLISSLRTIFQIQIPQYNWTGVFQNLKLAWRKTYCSFTKFESKYEYNHSHKNQKLLELKLFELGTQFIFFILHYSVNMNNLMLAFYSSYLKGCFFLLSRKIAKYVPTKYSEKNNTEHCPKRREKYIFNIHFEIIFAYPQNSYFHIIFTVLV